MTSRRLALWQALLAALQLLAAAGDLAAHVPPGVAWWLVIVVGMLQVATAVYTDRVASTPADAIRYAGAAASRRPPPT